MPQTHTPLALPHVAMISDYGCYNGGGKLQVFQQPRGPNTGMQTNCDTNGGGIAIQMGGACTPSKQEKGILLQEYRDTILTSIAVRLDVSLLRLIMVALLVDCVHMEYACSEGRCDAWQSVSPTSSDLLQSMFRVF